MGTSIDTYRDLAEKAQIAHAIANQAEESGHPRTVQVLRASAVEFERDLYRMALEELAEAGDARAAEVLVLVAEVGYV